MDITDVTMDPNLKCCVLGCHTKPNQRLRFYRFPCHSPQISSVWEQRISQSANIDVLNDHVCELHFDYRCKTGNECALEDCSLPTRNLPNFDTLYSTGNAHFQMSANRIEESSFSISMDALSYHCRFCLRRGLLYDIEASTYRSKSFLAFIDMPPNVLPDNTQTNACLSCLKSIVISHQLSVAVEQSNTIVQLLLQNPKQSKVVSNTNFFDMKSELTFCNLIPANSLSVKLEFEIEDKMLCANENYEHKLFVTGGPTSPVACVNTPNIGEKPICVAENHDNDSLVGDSFTFASDKQCQKEFHKSFAISGKYMTHLSGEGILDASENADSCVVMENTDDKAEVMVSNNSDDFCAENRELGPEQAPEYSNAVNDPTWQTTFTTIDKNTHWNEIDDVYVCPICDWRNPSFDTFNMHMDKHKVQIGKNSTIGSQELKTLETHPVRNEDRRYQCSECPKAFFKNLNFSQHKKMHKNGISYKCIECSKTFNQKANLDIHKRIHTNERPYKCAECPKTFNHKCNLVIHKRVHTNERPYNCTECPKTFIKNTNLIQHKRIHTKERPYKCIECSKTFSQKANLNMHKRIHTNERPYKCHECPKTFSQESSLDIHKRTHTNEKPYKCTECPKGFSLKSTLDTHTKIHANERLYKCTECPKTFNHKCNLDTHKRIHTNERPYKCIECLKTFSQKQHLSQHKRTHTNERPYKCTECPKAFNKNSDLNRHKIIHTNERPYKCTECPKTFGHRSNLIEHNTRHTDERPYQCTECTKAFGRKSELNRHKRIHTNERPYQCSECQKAFKQKSKLDTHKRIHTNERPYKCTECSKTFRQNGYLIEHKRIHTNERPYKCTECPKTFIKNGNLIQHKRIHTNERPYKCSECPKAFGRKSELSRHKIAHTNE